MAPDAGREGPLLSIGDLAEASGIAPDTLRVWERRYGRPVPVRLPSGHRRYRADQVSWLRRVAEALARGHRPGSVVPLDRRRLDDLLGGLREHGPARDVEPLLRAVRERRGADLLRNLARERRRLGPRAFLEERVAPLLEAAGRAWADGDLAIRHEHYLSELVEDVLRDLRRSVPVPPGAPAALLATLPGERHGLGLRMAAVVCALAGVRPHVLGTDTPAGDIAAAAADFGARAVLVSVSLATGGVATDRVLAGLRDLLPARTFLVAGGAGARGPRRGPRGVVHVDGLGGLDAWLRSTLVPRRPAG